jgi:hypothetical protein
VSEGDGGVERAFGEPDQLDVLAAARIPASGRARLPRPRRDATPAARLRGLVLEWGDRVMVHRQLLTWKGLAERDQRREDAHRCAPPAHEVDSG